MRACFTCDLSEVSMLSWLLLVSSAGGVESLMNIAGGYQDSQFDGGVESDPRRHGARPRRRGDAERAGLGRDPTGAIGSRSCPTRRR